MNDPIKNKVIFIFWTGTNQMSHRREHCINALKEQTGCKNKASALDLQKKSNR